MLDQFPSAIDVVSGVCEFYRQQLSQSRSTEDNDVKRRKVKHEGAGDAPKEDANNVNEDSALTIPNLSVTMPIRKKLDLVLTENFLLIRKSPADAPEFVLNYHTDKVEAAFIVDIPEKAKPQWNLVLAFTKPGTEGYEFFQVTIFDEAIKTVKKPVVGEQYSGSAKEMLLLYFQRRNISITSDETVPRGETIFHATAHRGSKDGLLYFFPSHIFFGFKKPLLLFRLEDIRAFSYASITRSTFNIVIKYWDVSINSEDEIEFSIIDQSHYERINQFVSLKELQNESMAEKRKARTDAKAMFPAELSRAQQEAKGSSGHAQPMESMAGDFSINGYDEDEDEDDDDFNSDVAEQNENGSGSDSDDGSDMEDDEDDGDEDDE